jgi:hypothetical protein
VLEIFATNTPDPPHLTPNSCFGAFQIFSLLHELQCERGRPDAINAQVRRTKSHRNYSQRMHPILPHWTPNSCFGGVSDYFVTAPTRCKWAERVLLMHKFLQRSRIKNFRNERTQSTPFDPKLMFCGVSDHFVIAQTSEQNMPNWCH